MDNVKFSHIVVTRFNLPIFHNLRNGRELKGIEADYLEQRFKIFEKYCYKSLRNQTCQNFKWIVLFSDRTPDTFKQRNIELRQLYSNYYPFYLDESKYVALNEAYEEEFKRMQAVSSFDRFHEDLDSERMQRIIIPLFIKDCIDEIVDGDFDYYITTRIDNDDAFHPKMIETIQKTVSFNGTSFPQIYNFLWGLQIMENKKIGQTIYYPCNHFCTCVERADTLFHSVFYWPHNKLDRFLPVKNIEDIPLWIEFIHDNNVGNNYKCSWRSSALFTNNALLKSFRLDVNISWKKQLSFLLSINIFFRWKNYIVFCIKNKYHL